MKQKICAGTLGVKAQETIIELLDTGYQFFDLATAYGGHCLVGQAIQGKNREDISICTKINDADLIAHDFSIKLILEPILKELNTEYVDILMLHSPALLLHAKAKGILDELISLQNEGIIKEIGVSNFELNDLKRLGRYKSFIKYNQIEMSPYFTREDVVEYCQKHSIRVMAYGAFGRGKVDVVADELIINIAEKYGVLPQQIILAWLTKQNIIPVVKASSLPHMQENIKALDVPLEDNEVSEISALNRDFQTCFWKKFVKLPNIDAFRTMPIEQHPHRFLSQNAVETGKEVSEISEEYTAKL